MRAVCFSILLLATACSTFSKSESRRFEIENTWARSTMTKEFLGFRRTHRMTPLILDQTIVQGNAIDGIVAYDRGSGSQLWRFNVENGVEGGAAASGDRLYFGGNDGFFYSVTLATGKSVWSVPVHAETLAAPTIEGDTVYFQNGADVVYALNKETGKQTWVYNRQVTTQLSIRATTSPVVAGDFVLTGFSDGYIVALKKRDGTLVWERKIGQAVRFKDVDSTPVLDGNTIYVASFDGSLVSLTLETGDVNWTVDQGAYAPVTLGTGRFSDRLFYSTANSEILAIEKANGKILTHIPVKKGIPTQVSLFKGFLVYGESDGALIVANPETGELVSKFTPGHGLMSRPALNEETGHAYFISNSGNLYALHMGYKPLSARLPWQR
jgi:outer membrane protein assembly factor BamB